MSKLLSRGNHKLPKTTAIFNLPAVMTCPRSTPECRKYCYARKAERMYPQVLPFRLTNLALTKSSAFVTDVSKELKNSRTVDTVRIHESGDFYDQKYLDKWITIAKTFPKLVFYAYTKSFHLDFSKRPSNFIVIFSDDRNKLPQYHKALDGVARVIMKNEPVPNGFFLCPGDCKTCNYCYNLNKPKSVAFRIH